MAKAFLSFLGTNDYLECTYQLEEETVENVRFVQEALIKLVCKDFEEKDQIIIFCTKKAEETNWLDSSKEGLASVLSRLNLDCNTQKIIIPEGKSESDIWEIFEIVLSGINNDDEIILDITHAFRSIPLFAMTLLNYAKFLKNIKLKGIYYGAFESIGPIREVRNIPVDKRVAPIFNLTSFNTLMEWSSAADTFINHGSAASLCKLIYNEINPILAESAGKNSEASIYKYTAKLLNSIGTFFSAVRGAEIVSGNSFIELKNKLSTISNSKRTIKPLIPILNLISNHIEAYKVDDVRNGFLAVEWCINHNLIQQGITLLQESIITYILAALNMPWNNLKNRELLPKCVKIDNMNIEEEKWKSDLLESKDVVHKILSNSEFKQLSKPFEKLREFRNDINHAGFIDNREAGSFEQKLRKIYQEVNEILGDG